MALTLFVETNFVLGIAKGQDLAAATFLEGDSRDIQLVIPGICFMEAFSTWESEKKQLKVFAERLAFQAREAARNALPRAKVLARHLEQSQIESVNVFDENEFRLDTVLYRLAEDARFIDLDADTIRDALSHEYIHDPTDNLILCSILRDAHRHPDGFKAFVSGNHKDFDQPSVQEALNAVGVRYFPRIDAALGWLRSQLPSSPNP